VFVTPDNIAYVVDAATCRVRRITPFPSVAESISCTASAARYIRPSGCTSFDQPVDKVRQRCYSRYRLQPLAVVVDGACVIT
jgi:hypothetical protein